MPPSFVVVIYVDLMLHSIGLGNSYFYEFLSGTYRSTEVGNVVFPSGKLGILRAPRLPTRKYELGNTSFRTQ